MASFPTDFLMFIIHSEPHTMVPRERRFNVATVTQNGEIVLIVSGIRRPLVPDCQ